MAKQKEKQLNRKTNFKIERYMVKQKDVYFNRTDIGK